MNKHLDWLRIFEECKRNVKTKIQNVKTSPAELDLRIGAGGDPMKPVDLAAESALVETIKQHCQSFTLISEESGIKKFGKNPDRLFVTTDPIDGTTNFIRGLPFYCSSIAVSDSPLLSQVFAALVVDFQHNISYTAIAGEGAQKNGYGITPSQASDLNKSLIGLDLNTTKKEIVPRLAALIQHTKHIRHFGANALEICYVADGLTDAFVDLRDKLRTTDVAAAFLILKEAGGIMTTPEGQPIDLKLDPTQRLSFVASGNIKIHNTILDLIKTGK